MSAWDDPKFTAEVVRRYLAGDGPSEIALCFNMTRNQILSKMQRLGLARRAASPPGPKVFRSSADRQALRDAAKAFLPAPDVPTQADRVHVALAAGPATILHLASATGLAEKVVAGCVARLIHAGRAQRLNPCRRWGLYAALAEGDTPKPVFRGDIARAAEEAYIAARRAGRSMHEAAGALYLSAASAEAFEEGFRAQTTSGFSRDSSCPKFANDDSHLAALAKLGAFPGWPSLAELRGRG